MSHTNRRTRLGAALIVPMLFLTACGGGGEEAAPAAPAPAPEADPAEGCEPITANASHHITAASAAHKGMVALAEDVAARTDGRVTIEVFSDAQLGGLGEMAENLRSGAVEIALIDTGQLSRFVPEVGVFNLPFLFEDMTEFNTLMDGPVGDAVNAKAIDEAGVVPLYWSAVGLRNMYFNGKEVRTPADIAGLKMRVPEAPVWVSTFNALGTQVAAIPAGELYQAVETGVVDGFELPLGTSVDLKLYEPVTSMSVTGHILTDILIAASPVFVDKLCDFDREALFAAADVAEAATRDQWVADNEAALVVLTEELTIVDDVDIAAFRAATDSVNEEFVAANGSELYDLIKAELGR